MTDDLQERARAHLRNWGTDSTGDRGEANVKMLLAFASPTPEPSGAIETARVLVARVVEGDSDNPLRAAEANAIYAGERDDTEAVKAALASLDAGSASS